MEVGADCDPPPRAGLISTAKIDRDQCFDRLSREKERINPKEDAMTTKELTRAKAADATPAPSAGAVRRVNPFDLLQREIDQVFDTFNGWPAAFTDRAFTPRMEITETDGSIEVSTELPGIDEKDVEISVADGMLTIRGEKKVEKDEKKKNYRLIERSYGSFERAIALPSGVDASKVKAKMTKGVLKVEVPKPAAAKSQQIQINAE
jgi:HSP20 family protein